MLKVDLHKQQIILLNLSLLTSVLLLFLRWSFLPHSAQYTFLYSLNSFKSIDNLFTDKGVYLLLTCIFFIGLALLSFQYFLKGFKKYRYKALLPFLINLFTILILVFMHRVVIFHDFHAHLGEREAIVAMIKSGALKPNESQRIKRLDNLSHVLHKIYKVQLPSQYTHLSQGGNKGGEINIITNQNNLNKIIVFFTSIDDVNYTALLYKINTFTPIENYLFGVGDLKSYAWLLEAKQMDDHWSWVDVVEK